MTCLQPLQQYLGNAYDQRQCGRCNHSCSHKQKQSDSPRPLRPEPATVPRPPSGRQIALIQPALRACWRVFNWISAAPAARHAVAPNDAPARSTTRSVPNTQEFCRAPRARAHTDDIHNSKAKYAARFSERGLHPDTVLGDDKAVTRD